MFRPTWFDFDGEKAAAAAGATNIQRGFFLRDALTLNQHQERGGPRLNATAIQILLLCVKGASRLSTKGPENKLVLVCRTLSTFDFDPGFDYLERNLKVAT